MSAQRPARSVPRRESAFSLTGADGMEASRINEDPFSGVSKTKRFLASPTYRNPQTTNHDNTATKGPDGAHHDRSELTNPPLNSTTRAGRGSARSTSGSGSSTARRSGGRRDVLEDRYFAPTHTATHSNSTAMYMEQQQQHISVGAKGGLEYNNNNNPIARITKKRAVRKVHRKSSCGGDGGSPPGSTDQLGIELEVEEDDDDDDEDHDAYAEEEERFSAALMTSHRGAAAEGQDGDDQHHEGYHNLRHLSTSSGGGNGTANQRGIHTPPKQAQTVTSSFNNSSSFTARPGGENILLLSSSRQGAGGAAGMENNNANNPNSADPNKNASLNHHSSYNLNNSSFNSHGASSMAVFMNPQTVANFAAAGGGGAGMGAGGGGNTNANKRFTTNFNPSAVAGTSSAASVASTGSHSGASPSLHYTSSANGREAAFSKIGITRDERQVRKSGWLDKFSVGRGFFPVRNWQKRWFSITADGLNYSKKPNGAMAARTFIPFVASRRPELVLMPVFLIPVINATLHPEACDAKMYYFGLRFEEKGKPHTLLMRTFSVGERDVWVRFLAQYLHAGCNTGIPVSHPLDPSVSRLPDPELLDLPERLQLKRAILEWDEGYQEYRHCHVDRVNRNIPGGSSCPEGRMHFLGAGGAGSLRGGKGGSIETASMRSSNHSRGGITVRKGSAYYTAAGLTRSNSEQSRGVGGGANTPQNNNNGAHLTPASAAFGVGCPISRTASSRSGAALAGGAHHTNPNSYGNDNTIIINYAAADYSANNGANTCNTRFATPTRNAAVATILGGDTLQATNVSTPAGNSGRFQQQRGYNEDNEPNTSASISYQRLRAATGELGELADSLLGSVEITIMDDTHVLALSGLNPALAKINESPYHHQLLLEALLGGAEGGVGQNEAGSLPRPPSSSHATRANSINHGGEGLAATPHSRSSPRSYQHLPASNSGGNHYNSPHNSHTNSRLLSPTPQQRHARSNVLTLPSSPPTPNHDDL